MKTVVNIVNSMRGGKAQKQRAFIAFVDNPDPEYGDISLYWYCQVRWLSAGNCLQQFFGLRNEILAFLTKENIGHEHQEKLEEIQFLNNLAFLTALKIPSKCFKLKTTRQEIKYIPALRAY
ncbi:uncharacterized protein LOC118195872 [Stegodyphus dumicola]|uniref:uncharacterized protein LOC118195872 n=1 Tax=Stegodyphus dumicola TaxID=202533 RepID=UPI0015AE3071|nr:uncharacterized protein LOC118195872 [Stegodyphus dumicola]